MPGLSGWLEVCDRSVVQFQCDGSSGAERVERYVMPLMIWNDKLSVGVEVLDDDHKKLISLINELYDGALAGNGKEILANILERLVAYTRFHFHREEKLFAETGYLDAATHKAQHDELAQWAVQAEIDFLHGRLRAPTLEVLNRLKDWLFDHINDSDKLYGPFLNAHGIH